MSNSPFRNCFQAKPGYKIVSSDFSAQEAVILLTHSKEDKLLKAVESGLDMHSYSASLVFSEEWKTRGGEAYPLGKPKDEYLKLLRDRTKILFFSLAYGRSAAGLAEVMQITKEEAQDIVNRFRAAFPKLVGYVESQGKFAVTNMKSYSNTKFNGIRFYSKGTDYKEKAAIERSGMNFSIQSTAAEMLKLSCIYLKREIDLNPKFKDKVLLTLPFHDEIFTQAKAEVAEDWAKVLSEKMEDSCEFILGHRLIKAEPEINDVWSSH